MSSHSKLLAHFESFLERGLAARLDELGCDRDSSTLLNGGVDFPGNSTNESLYLHYTVYFTFGG